MVQGGDVLGEVLGHARRAPDRPAVADLDRRLTYGQLAGEVSDTAAALAARGVTSGDRVVTLVGNSVDFVVSALACLWVGALFVPLPVDDPPARRARLLEDCRPALVLGEAAVPLSSLRSAGEAPPPATDPGRLAYAIYTSGTTGTPKGVLIRASAFAVAVAAAAAAVDLSPADRALCVSPVNFDGSFSTIFPTLATGATLSIPDREALLFPRTFFTMVQREGITVTSCSPSYLRLVARDGQLRRLGGSSLRVVALGGEAPAPADLRALLGAVPQVRVVNRYGPTETTIAVAHQELDAGMLASGVLPIGRPHRRSSFHLVDADGRLVAEANRVGELWIGGAQLMAGYWDAPAATAAVLRTDVVPGTLLYRTGDLAYRDDQGRYVCVGRADRVVKRRGVRLSLDEVAAATGAVPGVAAAACSAYDTGEGLGVVAFVVADPAVRPEEVRSATGDLLPAGMVPDRVVAVDRLPLGSSGKLDEGRLLAEAGLRPPPAVPH